MEESQAVNTIERYQCKNKKYIAHAIESSEVKDIFGDPTLNNLLQVANDQDYIALRGMVLQGFTEKKPIIPRNIQEYWIFIRVHKPRKYL